MDEYDDDASGTVENSESGRPNTCGLVVVEGPGATFEGSVIVVGSLMNYLYWSQFGSRPATALQLLRLPVSPFLLSP